MRATLPAMLALLAGGCGRIAFDAEGSATDAATDTAPGPDSSPPTEPVFMQKTEVNANDQFGAMVTLSGTVAVDDLLVVAIDIGPQPATLTSLVDSLGHSYTLIEETTNGNWSTHVGYALVASAGTVTVTAQRTAPAGTFNLRVFHYRNASSTMPVAWSGGTTGTTTGTDAATAVVDTDEPNTLLWAFITASGDSVGPGTGFTSISRLDGDLVQQRVAPAAGTQMLTANVGAVASSWALTGLVIRGR